MIFLRKSIFDLFFQNLSSWKDRRRKQSEEALQRVAEVKALDEDEVGQRKKM